jgi:hypothetical protein
MTNGGPQGDPDKPQVMYTGYLRRPDESDDFILLYIDAELGDSIRLNRLQVRRLYVEEHPKDPTLVEAVVFIDDDADVRLGRQDAGGDELFTDAIDASGLAGRFRSARRTRAHSFLKNCEPLPRLPDGWGGDVIAEYRGDERAAN